MTEGSAALEKAYRAGARYVEDLKEIAKKLRSLPQVDHSLPTLALVGAPNVGKSSLVKVSLVQHFGCSVCVICLVE